MGRKLLGFLRHLAADIVWFIIMSVTVTLPLLATLLIKGDGPEMARDPVIPFSLAWALLSVKPAIRLASAIAKKIFGVSIPQSKKPEASPDEAPKNRVRPSEMLAAQRRKRKNQE